MANGSDYALSEGTKRRNTETGDLFTTGVPTVKPASVNIYSIRGNGTNNDMRVRIRVPDMYLNYTTSGIYGELYNLKGIIFPYTPNINYDVRSDYTPVNSIHSNFTQHFYQRSSVGAISITGKFTVQNEKDAGVYLATIHLLKSLTKMRTANDAYAGSPPPICRLQGYGDYMFNNVPVVVQNFKVDLPDSVDYFTLGKEKENNTYGKDTVPVVSQLTVNCLPMYSRNEMQKFSVDDWLTQTKGSTFRNTGYL